MSPSIHVIEIDVTAEGNWSMDESRLTWRPGGEHGWYHSMSFDPFPAYCHDHDAVDAAVAHVLACWTPAWDVDLVLADREPTGRFNGASSLTAGKRPCDREGCSCGQTETTPNRGLIVLGGKRIPPIPAMSRYLVGHEYGHNVEWMLNAARGAKQADDETLAREYAVMRGLPDSANHHGAGGRWHDAVAEILACDFRILVCELEVDAWPHPGIPRPEAVAGLEAWWSDAATWHLPDSDAA